MAKTVLILADAFPPGFAPRMGYLSKYLSKHGWKGIAVSPVRDVDNNNFNFLSGYIPCKMLYVSKQSRTNLIKRKIDSQILRRKMINCVKEILSHRKIDVLLCSTSHLFPLNIAYEISKKNGIPWIADLRDIYEQYPVKGFFLMELYKKKCMLKRNRLLKHAKIITTVSNKHVETLGRLGLNAHCIFNGFDSAIFAPSKNHNLDKFRIIYAGRLEERQVGQDVSPLFSVIQQLYIDNDIDFENCRIQFYSNKKSHQIVNELKEFFRIAEFVDCFDYVSGYEVPKILNESSILLLLLSKGNLGIMTTKFFEYLAVARPILCIWSDEGAVEDIIINSNAGVAAKTEDDIKYFIKTKYDEWLKTKYTESDVDLNYIKYFTREHGAKQFIELFNAALES